MSLTARELAILQTPPGPDYHDRLNALIARLRGLSIIHRGSVSGGRGIVAGTAIPDSEADEKLIHRWYLSENSDPFIDQVGSNDGANNGTTKVTGSQYVDRAARQGNGTDDYIEVGTAAPSTDSRFAIAFTLAEFTISSRAEPLSVNNSNDNQRLQTAVSFSNSGDIAFDITDADSDTVRVRTSGGLVDDGARYRLVFNKTGPTASDLEIWLTGSEQNTSVDNNQGDGANSFTGWDNSTYLFARSAGGSGSYYLPAVLDDVCVFGDSLTQSEIGSYVLI